jgi:Protein of unknown function (DUF1570)
MIRRGLALMAAACVGGCSGSGIAPEHRASPAVVAAFEVEDWEYEGHAGKLIRTPSYRLFTTAPDVAMVDQMPRFLEAALERYTTGLGPLSRPALRLDTFLMGDRDQWASLTRQVMGREAATFLRIDRGGFASGGRALLWTIGRRDTFAIAAHEGWHQYTQRTFRESLPAWLEEGIAVFMEGFVEDPATPGRPLFLGWANLERFEQLRRASARGGLIPLTGLLEASPQDLLAGSTEGTLTYYAELWALTHFLREGDGDRSRRALGHVAADAQAGRLKATVRAAGQMGPAGVFRAYFDPDLAAADVRFRAFIAKVVAGGTPETIARGESPVAKSP